MPLFRWRPPIRVVDRPNPERNARNGMLGVTMFGNPGSDAASLAQELAERDRKWADWYWLAWALAGVAAGLVLILALWSWSTAGYAVAAGAVPILAALGAQRLPAYRRRLELWGHAVEAQARAAVYGGRVEDHLAQAARDLVRGYDGIFDGWSQARLVAMMQTRGPAAAAFVARVLPVLIEFRARWR